MGARVSSYRRQLLNSQLSESTRTGGTEAEAPPQSSRLKRAYGGTEYGERAQPLYRRAGSAASAAA